MEKGSGRTGNIIQNDRQGSMKLKNGRKIDETGDGNRGYMGKSSLCL